MACIVVHGGAGATAVDDDSVGAKRGCLEAAQAGWSVLTGGGSALDAVEAAVRVMEDNPLFNAGTGSALNRDGEVELDASVMNGADLAAGAVAAVRAFRNPISVARAVMEGSPHVLLVADGATHFALEHGFGQVDPATLVTARALAWWKARREQNHGTVGAVACDAHGHVAAATSTGGTSGKLPGRVGDSPLIGCGTYADDRLGAVSCTGLGEAIIRVTLARRALEFIDRGRSAPDAARAAVAELARVKGTGGLIVVTPRGEPAWAFTTQRMARACIDSQGNATSGFEPDSQGGNH